MWHQMQPAHWFKVLAHIALQMEQPQYIWSQKKKVHSLSRLGNTEMAVGGANALPRSARLIALAHWRPRSPTRRRHDRGTPLYSVLALRPSGLGHGAICTTEGTIPSIHSEGA